MLSRTLGAVAATSLAVAGVIVAPSADAASGLCSGTYPGTTNTWTGNGDGSKWSDAHNWSAGTVPSASQRVCIGTSKSGKRVSVVLSGTHQVAAIDLGDHARLTVKPGGGLLLSAPKGSSPTTSRVAKGTQLLVAAAVLGGSSPLVVSGTLGISGQYVGTHRDLALQTGSGQTEIAAGGTMLISGTRFGGTELSDGRTIDNFGTVTFSGLGYVAADRGTAWIDEARSRIVFSGVGGIYPSTAGTGPAATLQQHGALIRNKGGTNVVVLGVPVRFGASTPHVTVKVGSIVLNSAVAPKAPVGRSAGYGVGSCTLVKVALCKRPNATKGVPQVAFAGTSNAAPKTSQLAVSLGNGPAKLKGRRVLGKQVDVTAPTAKTSHSTHLTFDYDATTPGLRARATPTVFRGKHAIALCKVHGLTALNTSCILSEKVAKGGGAALKGDLSIILITIQPDGHWLVAE
jgi:hypothetical protein